MPPPVRSVLVAGMHDENTQFTRYIDDLMLDWEHLPRVINGYIPTKYDALLICTSQFGHSSYAQVKEAYVNKPVFLTRRGISEVREQIEASLFPDPDDAKILRMDSTIGPPLIARFWWIMALFYKHNDTVKVDSIQRFFSRFNKNQKNQIQNIWYEARKAGFLEENGRGSCTFRGVPEHIFWSIVNEHKLFLNDETIRLIPVKSKVKKTVMAPPAIFQSHVTKQVAIDEITIEVDHQRPLILMEKIKEQDLTENKEEIINMESIEIMYEAISSIQKELKEFREEMKGTNLIINKVMPKLSGLSPEKIEKIDKMIELFIQ